MAVDYRAANEMDAVILARTMRDSDREEVMATIGSDVCGALRRGVRTSTQCRVALVDGVPAALWGVAPVSVLQGIGSPWFVASDLAEDKRYRKHMLVDARDHVAMFLQEYDELVNYVYSGHTKAKRWLQMLGFTIEKSPEPYGVENKPFHKFWMMANVRSSSISCATIA